MANEEHINKIIENTFKVLSAINNNEHKNSRLIFPKYRNENTRYCEQELRFLFVEQFLLYCANPKNIECKDWLYSVETPTEEKYLFSENGVKLKQPKKVDARDKKGQSAMIDLTIHDKNFDRIALIEFKANQVSESKFDKDFKKLQNEPKESLRYFVMYVIAPNPHRAINALKRKIGSKDSNTTFICYDLLHANYLIDERIKA